MQGRRRRTLFRSLAVRLGLLLAVGLVVAPVIATTPSGALAAPLGPLPAALCAGATTPTSFTGSLRVDGGGTAPPSVANRTLELSYWIDLNFTPRNGSSILSCNSEHVLVTTDSLGGFSVAASVPTSSCNSASCSVYSGPFGPLVLSVPNGVPAGYFFTQSITGSQVGVAFVAALASTRLVPSSRVTLSTDAPTIVHAYPTAGNGAASPATVGFDWRIVGTGWTLNGSGTANVTIEAIDGALPGSLTVWTNGSYNGTAESAPPVTLDLAAAPTTTSGGSVVPTSLDVGDPATFTVTGQGAGGYAYHADVSPGLGVPQAVAACTTSVVAGGLVALSCSTSVVYDSAGIATPTANLTNGFSSDFRAFAPVTVAPALGLTITPATAVAYVGATVPVTVAVDTATGTSPRGPACLWPGTGWSYCVAGPGPSYPFSVAYGTAGPYEGRATIADASGANATTMFSARIFERPNLSLLVASTNSLGVAESATVVASIEGGALPLTYWWNASAPAGTLFEGTATADGSIVLHFVAHVSGLTTLNLTVVDALGTRVSSGTRISVSAGPAVGLRVAASVGSPVAGHPVPLAWTAVDAVGEVVDDWAKPVSLVLSPAPGSSASMPATRVNLSGALVVAAADGSYPVPSTAWSAGTLRLAIAFDGAGAFVASLRGGPTLAPGATSSTLLLVGPDTGNLVLFHPSVAIAGLRTNQTLWQISDEFGDALLGGWIRVQTTIDGVPSSTASRIHASAGAMSSVWVNYSVPDGVAATISVLSDPEPTLLLTIAIPGPSPSSVLPTAWLLVALGAAIAAGAAFGLWQRSRRPAFPDASTPLDAAATEEELRRWAEGRAHVLQRASTERGATLDELAQGFVGRPPRPEEMTDWVASLVAEGSVRTVLGDDGRSRFLKVHGDDAAPLRVQLDDRALADALDRRAQLDGSAEEDPP